MFVTVATAVPSPDFGAVPASVEVVSAHATREAAARTGRPVVAVTFDVAGKRRRPRKGDVLGTTTEGLRVYAVAPRA